METNKKTDQSANPMILRYNVYRDFYRTGGRYLGRIKCATYEEGLRITKERFGDDVEMIGPIQQTGK